MNFYKQMLYKILQITKCRLFMIANYGYSYAAFI
jgi:hypothetical protein